MSRHQVPPLAVRQLVGDAWARRLEQDRLKPATRARKLAAVSSLYQYAVDEGLIEDNPFKAVTRPDIDPDHSDTIALDEKQSAALMAAATRDGQLSKVLVGILLTTGMRAEGILSLQVENLGTDHGRRTVTVTRKGVRRQRLPLPVALAHDLDVLLNGRTAGPMFLFRGRAMLYDRLHDLIGRLGRRIGVPGLHPHSLRSTYATILLDNNVPVQHVQDGMGHKDPRMTRRYDKGRARMARLGRSADLIAGHVLAAVPDEPTPPE